MKYFKSRLSVQILILLFLLAGTAFCADKDDRLFQLSTLNALIEGVYDGNFSCGDLRSKGDFGIGTFNAVDGEMVMLDGSIYRIRSDGSVTRAAASDMTPFALAVNFSPDITLEPQSGINLKQLQEYIDFSLPTRNDIYAVKVTGTFEDIKLRSVPKQKKPYPKLTEVTKTQPVFELRKIEGTLVGFRFPDYMNGVNLPGYHFHFISSDRSHGGHVLDLTLGGSRIEIDTIRSYTLQLPASAEFDRARINNNASAAKVEK